MDRKSCFWQVDPKLDAQELLVFITSWERVFTWKVMPYNVTNATTIFQELKNKVLSIPHFPLVV